MVGKVMVVVAAMVVVMTVIKMLGVVVVTLMIMKMMVTGAEQFFKDFLPLSNFFCELSEVSPISKQLTLS